MKGSERNRIGAISQSLLSTNSSRGNVKEKGMVKKCQTQEGDVRTLIRTKVIFLELPSV